MEDHPPMDPGREAPNQWSRAGGTSEVEPGRIPWRTTFQLIQGVRHQFSGEKNKNRDCNGKWKVKALLIDNLGKDGMELKF
ncbi:uncharacterized protein [Zea mays]|uniref:uncharacterized protein isoform X2 n=1 Tax=Zea mays TaxID=4577 RepID=UPI0009AA2733|nr:uncharacterized protein LOC109944815 isoform X2 [Zea mays]|eukprot:XP_020405800.1 uncharacterized protein LOC109944815 isoform X2 [Zea mays]